MANGDLNGWKEIAAHLGKAVRTAQRWEEELGLPVHRIPGPGGEIIYARTAELEEWKRKAGSTRAGQRVLQSHDEEAAARRSAPPDRSMAVWLVWALGGLALLVVVGVVIGSRGIPRQLGRTPEPPSRTDASSGPSYTGREGLDTGSWPVAGHDMHRPQQSHLLGPTDGHRVVRIADARPSLIEDAAHSPLITIDRRTLVFGNCGSVEAVDLDGRSIWRRALDQQPVAYSPSGFVMTSVGALVVTTHQCPGSVNRWELPVLWLGSGGQVTGTNVQVQMPTGPGVGPDGTIYTVSESNSVTGYSSLVSERVWKTDLPGYGTGATALDSRGNLYIGTDGSNYHQASLWSLAPNGTVRWSTGSGVLTTPVVTPGDRVVVAGDDRLFSYTADGTLRWAIPIASTHGQLAPLALGGSGVIYVRTWSGVSAVGADGETLWTVPSREDRALAGVILDKDENLYVGFGNQVCSLTAGGLTRWCAPLDGPGAMIIAGDGLLYVFDRRRVLYAIGHEPPRPVGEAVSEHTQ